MNELNLVEILKDCPKGTKLYSPLYGEVIFQYIDYNSKYLHIAVLRDNATCYFAMDGRKDPSISDQECMLFPSRDVRTWDNFKPKKPKFDPKTLNAFDKVLVKGEFNDEWRCELFSHTIYTPEYSFRCIYSTYKCCIPYNDDTKHLVGTYDEAPEFYRYWEE